MEEEKNKNENILIQDKEKLDNEKKLKLLEEQLAKQREEWGGKLLNLIQMMEKVEKLSEVQVITLSYRHILVDQVTKLNIQYQKIKSIYEKQYKIKLLEYYNYDYRLSDKHKDTMIAADLSFYKKQINFLNIQIEYYMESIKLLDQIIWAIKNRISIEQLGMS